MSDLPSLMPPNVLGVERDFEQLTRRLKGLSLPIEVLWNPDLCPVNLLPYLAWAMSVEDWEPDWADEVKRNIIKSSVHIHRKKGTVGAVKQSLAALGMEIELTEWFQNGDAPHTFRLDVLIEEVFKAGFRITPELVADVDRLIRNVKPVRSHYALRVGERMSTDVYARTGTGHRQIDRASHVPIPRTHQFGTAPMLRTGMRDQVRSHITHDVLVRIAA